MPSCKSVLAPWFVVASALAGDPPGELEAPTSAPRLDERGATPLPLVERAAYEREAAGEKAFVPPEHDPWSDAPQTRYALIGYPRGERITCAVRFGTSRHRVIVDRNGDGDLRDDRVHRTKRRGRHHTVDVDLERPPIPIRLALAEREGEVDRQRILLFERSLREGTLRLDETEVAFAVEGAFGRFEDGWSAAYFDTNGDGELDFRQRSDEAYRSAADEYVNLAGRSWTFAVSPDGERLSLRELATVRPPRARLAPGNPAPDFSFTDLDGKPGKLSDYAGKVVVLYFWATWCGPCRGETPHLIEVEERYGDQGLTVLAVAKDDRPEAIREHNAARGVTWRQTVDLPEGPIVELYRAHSIPSILLIDRAGTIVDDALRGRRIVEQVTSLFEDDQDPPPRPGVP